MHNEISIKLFYFTSTRNVSQIFFTRNSRKQICLILRKKYVTHSTLLKSTNVVGLRHQTDVKIRHECLLIKF